jgi:hypothetical protein
MPARRSAVLLPDAPPGDTGPWEVTIPDWHPLSLNQMIGFNKFVVTRRKHKDAGLVGAACLMAGVPRATGKRRVTLTIVLGPRQKGRDPDAFHKSTCDSLRSCGALVNDSKEWVELPPVRYERAMRRSTRITLEDVG